MAKRKKRKLRATTQPGIGVDTAGGPLIDPTANVIALNKAGHIRQDDLRKSERRYILSELRRVEDKALFVKELTTVHQIHDYALHKAEAGRLDALRQNDREDVKALAVATNQRAEVLAASFASAMAEQTKRISNIELAQSEGRGKATIESPMMVEMVSELKALRREQTSTLGQRQGALSTREMISWILLTLVGLYTLYRSMKP